MTNPGLKKRSAWRFLVAAFFLSYVSPASAWGQKTERARQLGAKIYCICGCYQPAALCKHPGGSFSGPCDVAQTMLKKMDEFVARGEPDDLTLQAFVQEYGPAVLIKPPAKGFSMMVWILPILAPLAGLLVLRIVLARWRRVSAAAAQPVPAKWLEQARREAGSETDA